ncbi:MAG: hypothetical protein RMY34_36535 [Aulosira sp. DedQUE10]|nr:hypothetical protein [Aulosira sp. DedQUE10]
MEAATFDIRNFIDCLSPAKGKDRYLCPVCGGDNLTINPQNGAYQCWNGCECEDIREAVSPLRQPVAAQQSNHPPKLKPKQSSQPNTLTPTPIPDKPIELAILPAPVESPKRHKTGKVYQITYHYSDTQYVLRTETENGKKHSTIKPKPYYIDVSGQHHVGKGFKIWEPYRINEVRTHSDNKWVLGLEGENCVEVTRRHLQIVSFTLQGSDWTEDALTRTMQQIKDAGISGVVYFPDNDATGYSKAQKAALAADKIRLPFIQINPVRLWADCPEKGDIVDWIKWGMAQDMNPEEFIRRLEQEIHQAAQERRSQPHKPQISDDSSNVPDLDNPNLTFIQQAFNELYGDKPWICFDDKLYYWTGKNYKYSSDSVERPRIANFCNSFAVPNKQGYLTYPYAKPSKVREVLQWVKDRYEIDPDLINPPGLNCTNGVLQFIWNKQEPSWKLLDHDPSFYYTYEPLATYNPDADPTNCDRLLEVLDKQEQEIFLRTIAASLDLKTVRRYKGRVVRGLLLKGDGNNGKDTLREAVAQMYGYQGMTGCTLSDFKAYDEGRKFPLSRLQKSRVNWATENANSAVLDKLQSVKAFLTGDTLSKESKGQDESDYTPTGIGLFNINDTPNLEGILEAISS